MVFVSSFTRTSEYVSTLSFSSSRRLFSTERLALVALIVRSTLPSFWPMSANFTCTRAFCFPFRSMVPRSSSPARKNSFSFWVRSARLASSFSISAVS